LIEKGANVDARALDKSTPLCFAAEKGHVAIAKLLIEAGATLEAKNDPEEKGGATPLLLAAHNGQTE
jgi:ankyrin repeat protein